MLIIGCTRIQNDLPPTVHILALHKPFNTILIRTSRAARPVARRMCGCRQVSACIYFPGRTVHVLIWQCYQRALFVSFVDSYYTRSSYTELCVKGRCLQGSLTKSRTAYTLVVYIPRLFEVFPLLAAGVLEHPQLSKASRLAYLMSSGSLVSCGTCPEAIVLLVGNDRSAGAQMQQAKFARGPPDRGST